MRTRTIFALLAPLLAVASPAGAKGEKAPLLLDATKLDPAQVLPPPPAPDSAEVRDELAQLHAIDKARTQADFDDAVREEHTKDGSIFHDAIGPAFDLAKLPATAALLDTVRREEKAAADRAKAHFLRTRPWLVAKDLRPCNGGDDEPQSSYPSGHTTMGYSMAAVLARLVPAHADAIMARAARYARSRLVCEVHFRSDVAGGQAYGMVIAERLMLEPAFQVAFKDAARELQAAGIR